MPNSSSTPGVAAGRLAARAYGENFADLRPPFTSHEAAVAADRCYFCHDAPCVAVCPTAIDIPLFVRQISTGTARAAAKTIFDRNILGGMCARGLPDRDALRAGVPCAKRPRASGGDRPAAALCHRRADGARGHPYERAAPTGRRVAVVGAGPAGLACAHRLAMRGHAVVLYDARAKAGGLNEYGIASYKTVDDFAAREVDWLLGIGGITWSWGGAWGTTWRSTHS